MNQLEPKILLIYDSEFEARIIDNYLKKLNLCDVSGTNHLMTGVSFCTKNKVDIIIANLSLNNQLIAERLLSKKVLLGIPMIFYTKDKKLYTDFKSSNLLNENPQIDILLNPITSNKLNVLIDKLFKLKLEKKTKKYFFAKKQLGIVEKVFYQEITYIESEVSYCKLHTNYGTYRISTSMPKLLQDLGSEFIKIHEKYAVNSKKVIEFSVEKIKMENLILPIGKIFYKQAKLQFDTKKKKPKKYLSN
jgi:hypothetical protein